MLTRWVPKSTRYREKCQQHCGRTCSYQGCDAPINPRGLCSEYGGRNCCSHSRCLKQVISKGLCRAHGGGSQCSQPGCSKYAKSKGLCDVSV
ncbi:hypothetical protein PHMEG_00021253 [Phytophthora megakarya]|uniref:Uncharacterized protein n=1 Tax=Phytophthora megakarya TaxID=4795 RepID=A0A225VP08_9STRA|nr:hypothetical protein PHMEG_00021253 [Phytophthora megakarya]